MKRYELQFRLSCYVQKQESNSFICSKVHDLLGLDHVCGRDDDRSFVFVGGAPLSDSTYEYFRSIDVLLGGTYGTTELTGPLTNNIPGPSHRPGTVGRIGFGALTRLEEADEDGVGEIVCGSRNVFMGYHKDEKKTKESFTKDLWFKTGDQVKNHDAPSKFLIRCSIVILLYGSRASSTRTPS